VTAGAPRAAAGPSPAYSRYVLALLFVVYVFNFVDRQVLAMLIGPIRDEFGASDTLMGLLSGFAFALFYTLAGIPIARWADRGSRRTVISCALLVWSAMTAASGMARSFAQLAVARVLVGVGEAGGTPPSHALISDYFPPQRRATALALYGNGVYVGAGLAYLAGGYIVTHYDWRTVYYAVGVAGLPLVLLVWLTVRELPRGASEVARAAPAPAGQGFRSVLRYLLARPSFVWLVAGASCQAVSGYAFLGWAPEFLSRVHGMPRVEIGVWLGSILLVAGCGGITLGGIAADRLARVDRRWYTWLSAIVSVAGLPFALAFLLLGSPRAALLAFAPFYFVSNMYVGPLWSLTQSLVRPDMRATASAILLFILNIVGLGAGPFVVGFLNDALADRFGDHAIRYSLVVVALVGALAAPGFLRAARTLREDLDRAV